MEAAAETALRALFDEHAHALFAHVLRLTDGDRGRAEDIVQETLVRAWQSGEALDDRLPVRPWLLTVARRIAIDEHRRRRARPPESGGWDVAAALAGVPDAATMDARLDRMVVLDALDSLSHDHREVIVATYFEGRTVAEAARHLGVPEGTVKSRSYYALKALRLALAERGTWR